MNTPDVWWKPAGVFFEKLSHKTEQANAVPKRLHRLGLREGARTQEEIAAEMTKVTCSWCGQSCRWLCGPWERGQELGHWPLGFSVHGSLKVGLQADPWSGGGGWVEWSVSGPSLRDLTEKGRGSHLCRWAGDSERNPSTGGSLSWKHF